MSHHFRLVRLLLSGIALTLSACATGPELDVTIHESERGAVYVERFADRSFHASHPMRVSADMMTRILRGVVVQDTGGILGSLLVSKPQTMQAFRNEDVEYLAPLLADGLARAASDQQVGFRIVQVSEPVSPQSGGLTFCASSVRFPGACSSERPLLTEGSLYISGRSLYLTLTEYRHRLEEGATIDKTGRRVSNSAGLTNRTVHFVPESAARSTNATLVINYDLLAAMPAASDMRPAAAQAPTPATAEPTQRNTDMDELRKELQDIKKKLAEQEAERTRSIPSSSQNPTPRSNP
jgi:hypothetical protein